MKPNAHLWSMQRGDRAVGGVGMVHLFDGSRQVTERAYAQVSHLQTCHVSWPPRRKESLSFSHSPLGIDNYIFHLENLQL